MSHLNVPQIEIETADFNYYAVQKQMERLDWHAISHVNWADTYPYKPSVNFQIAHQNHTIFLHYRVEEEFVRAAYIRPNESVWEDSCAEFFISFDGRKTYYNLEFNVLGTGLIGYGTSDKNTRNRLSAADIEKVCTVTSVVNINGKKTWNIILAIPTQVFGTQQPASLSGMKAFANFYKCGDGLPTPHFLSWNRIDHPAPNFHLPEYFGEITFE